ncbi:response regulator transcription factor [Azovibrio restrictus]|uniref:response regulator transcription factor n=1 Tax=Azovibrio restrictus TaxID=146938 RepID=UPI0026EE7671|nr:response regulator [Azovibrio restrictus]
MPARSRSVLIVDDNDVMRTLLRAILRSDNQFNVVGEARNGLAALEMVRRHQPEIVCLDVVMPEMDGLEALREIRQLRPETQVVIITGTPSAGNVQEAMSLGANGFIIKPFNAAKILDTLAALPRP